MAALDTNVVIRLLLGDETAQARAAERLVASEPCTVSASVMMECEWVLRAAYKMAPPLIEECLRSFLALENIAPAEPVLVQRCLDAYAKGIDFADALHALQCEDEQRFVTFDKSFAKSAPLAGLKHVSLITNHSLVGRSQRKNR